MTLLERRVASMMTKEASQRNEQMWNRPVPLPITIVSLLLARSPGRYSGGSHKILSEDEVTKADLIPSLLTGSSGNPAAELATRIVMEQTTSRPSPQSSCCHR
jgi:hypothetical protein